MTGIQDTEENCDQVLLDVHNALTAKQALSQSPGDENDIAYYATSYGETVLVNGNYYAPLKKERFPKWEPVIESCLTQDQLDNYLTIPE